MDRFASSDICVSKLAPDQDIFVLVCFHFGLKTEISDRKLKISNLKKLNKIVKILCIIFNFPIFSTTCRK